MNTKKWLVVGASAFLLAAPLALADQADSGATPRFWSLIVSFFEDGGYVDPNGGGAHLFEGDNGSSVDPFGRRPAGREGSGLDPHGSAAGDEGGFVDPNGLRADCGPTIDPNGQRSAVGDKGMGLDPNGG